VMVFARGGAALAVATGAALAGLAARRAATMGRLLLNVMEFPSPVTGPWIPVLVAKA
jgi:hypothetical protein